MEGDELGAYPGKGRGYLGEWREGRSWVKDEEQRHIFFSKLYLFTHV
jgi:hypothetical protein